MPTDNNAKETAIYSLFRLVTYVLAFLGGIATVVMMLIINMDVIGRSFLGTPFPATAEIISASIVAVVFLQFPFTSLNKRNVRSDMFLNRLRAKTHRGAEFVDGIHYAIGAMMAAILTYYVVPEVFEIIENHETVGIHGVLLLPRGPFVVPVAIGVVLTTVAFAILAVRQFAQLNKDGSINDEH